LRIGDWHIDPVAGQISRGGESVRVEARTLMLLRELAQHPGETVSIDQLLDRVWAGVVVTPDSVYQAIATLRRLLGDDPKQPRYIATVPRLGYRLIAPVIETDGELRQSPAALDPLARQVPLVPERPARPDRRAVTVGAAVAGIGLLAGLILLRPFDFPATHRRGSPFSVGVAPFVDLTPSMDQEQLADEMTEGVADRLGHDPAFRTPGFRSSYYLIGKSVSVAQAGRALAVDYVLDGSVRRSGDTLRVVARLVRTDSGVVLWSQVYERSLQKLNVVQDEISRDVAATLSKGSHPAG
jgi:DNA-binding winged helix-turn-helix (wHTH) protein/TolB-like protein